MLRVFLSLASFVQPQHSYRQLSSVTRHQSGPAIPAYIHKNFPGAEADTVGANVADVFTALEMQGTTLDDISVSNLFHISRGRNGEWDFDYNLVDVGTPYYNEDEERPPEEAVTATAQFSSLPPSHVAQVRFERGFLDEDVEYDPSLVREDVNYATRIFVKRSPSGPEITIYVPGTKTYDVGGMTGDPHASERIGPACDRANLAITVALIAAMRVSGDADLVERTVYAGSHELIKRLHGRYVLVDYMWYQIQRAFDGIPPLTYGGFVKNRRDDVSRIPCHDPRQREHQGCHTHTWNYLSRRELGPAYYRKICGDIASRPDDDLWKIKAKKIICDASHPMSYVCTKDQCA